MNRLCHYFVKAFICMLWTSKFYISYSFLHLLATPRSYYLASAEPLNPSNLTKLLNNELSNVEQLCIDCKIVSESIEGVLKSPRQMNAYGLLSDRIDLDKIKKGICKDIFNDVSRQKCKNFYLNHEDTLIKWKQSNSRISFFDFTCIKELKYCCPRNSFGPRCSKCIECSHNQHCHGEGTRAGNGTCVCKEGHSGPGCTTCSPGFYPETKYLISSEDSKEKQKVTCKACHKSCLYCRKEGPLGCEVCQSGYTWLTAYGCSDIDECIRGKHKICGPNTFCVNTEGSFFCYECDRACDGCHGDGPDMCLKCGKDYELVKGNCVAKKKTILSPEANYYRYAIYAGLTICTCIIFNNNVYIASAIGLVLALYIGLSEYIMSTHTHELTNMSHDGVNL